MKRTAKEIQNESNIKALKRAREALALSRKELASRLKISVSAVEKYERGVDILSEERIEKILEALEITPEQFQKLKRGKSLNTRADRKKNVLKNSDRRSYQKIITKECKVLRSLRRQKGFSQDRASALCGYSRPTIGHIENGRIELTAERIKHIVNCYGFSFSEFEKSLEQEELKDEKVDSCVAKIRGLSDEKLNLLKGILESF